MRLLIIGTLEGQIGAASQIAIQRGARVEQVDTTDAGLAALRIGQGADLVMIDVTLDVGGFIKSLKSERISLPVVACGIGNDTKAAVRAIRAGAKEYVPLPPSTDLIAAVLEAVAEENYAIVHKDPQDGGSPEACRPGGAQRCHHPDHRGVRHRQGTGGPPGSRQKRPQRR
ncbi:MAG TPA: response regulator [Rhodospirillales bacterium]|nr:response regulator [Rhodospirillales bacterium]